MLLPLLALAAAAVSPDLLFARLSTVHEVDVKDARHGGELRVPALNHSFPLTQHAELFHPDYRVYIDGARILAPKTQCFLRGPDGEHVSVCNGHARGHFRHEGRVWALQQTDAYGSAHVFAYPLDEVPRDMALPEGHQRHGVEPPELPVELRAAASAASHYEGEASATGTGRFLEVVLVSDESQAAQYGGNVEAQAASLLQTVAVMHGTKPTQSSGASLTVVLRAQLVVTDNAGQGLVTPYNTDRTLITSRTYLDNFASWVESRMTALSITNWDSAALLSNTLFDANTLGLAFTGATCTRGARVSVNSLRRGSDTFDASTIAHELGHGWGACHDPPASRTGPTCATNLTGLNCGGFLMDATGDPSADDTAVPIAFSACTDADFAVFLRDASSSCLGATSDGGGGGAPVCGNGAIEAGEQCDTGSTGNTSCCINCQLSGDAQCHAGDACCDSNCQFVVSGTVCRNGREACDPSESCTGASGLCPVDVNTCSGNGGGGGSSSNDFSAGQIAGVSLAAAAAVGASIWLLA